MALSTRSLVPEPTGEGPSPHPVHPVLSSLWRLRRRILSGGRGDRDAAQCLLVHDDIADGSELRRGRPTLPADYGQALSLNAGDALVVLANQVLRRHTRTLDHEIADRVLDEFDNMALRTLEGQATELGWRRDQSST